MKRQVKVSIKDVATTIAIIEKELQDGINIQENTVKITKITDSLSLEDMLKIDEYISENNLLTK